MEWLGTSSFTEWTGTILASWLQISAVWLSLAITSMVMREMLGSSVVPTAKDSTLKPFRENRREIWDNTPDSFSTSTDKVRSFTSSITLASSR